MGRRVPAVSGHREAPVQTRRPLCTGGSPNYNLLGLVTIKCLYDDWNNALIGNTFIHNGFYGNPTNGDFAEITATPGNPINCFSGNTNPSGQLTSSPGEPAGDTAQLRTDRISARSAT